MKKVSLLFLILTMWLHGSIAQNCDLKEDRKDAYGNVVRSAEWFHSTTDGKELTLYMSRYGDRYSFLFSLDQPRNSNSVVSFNLDPDMHPVTFLLSNGSSVKAWIGEKGVKRSETKFGKVTFSEEYRIQDGSINYFDQASVRAIVFHCSGREEGTGNARNEIRFPLNPEEGEALSRSFRCISREADRKPQRLQLKPTPDRPRKSDSEKTSSSSTDQLLRRLITTVGEGNRAIEESVRESGATQMEMNHLMMEKLEGLTTAIDKLNETKAKKDGFTPRIFGFGVYFKTNYLFGETQVTSQTTNSQFAGTNLGTADYNVANRFMNGTSINMSFSAGMKKKLGFRFEPFADFLVYHNKSESAGSNVKNEASSRQIETGLRLLFMIRKGRVNIYPGLTGSYVNQFIQANNTDQAGSMTTTVRRDGGSMGLVLGGEYLLTPHIGVRVESGMLYYILGETETRTSGTNIETETNKNGYTSGLFGSYARLGCSFYF